MPTAIRQVDLGAPLTDVHGLADWTRCMLVFRWRGHVVGRAFVPVPDSSLRSDDIRAAAHASLGPAAVRAWVEGTLDLDERCAGPVSASTVTVAVCTHERPHDVARALVALTQLSPAPCEILVVDNAPLTSRTAEVVAAHPGVRYVVEPVQGLNRARNRALREARGDIVAFSDDDAVPEPEWCEALRRAFVHPRILCVTGLTLPLELDTPAQELFEEHCSFVRGFGWRVWDGRIDSPRAVSAIGAGANMAVRREAGPLLDWFDERLDAGTPTRSGGDHEWFSRILDRGYRIVYEPHAVSWHRHRRTFDELIATVRGYGTGVWAMWTKQLWEARDLGVLRPAWNWFRYDHLPLLLRPVRLLRPGSTRDRLRRAELRGCLSGPTAWLASNRLLRVSR